MTELYEFPLSGNCHKVRLMLSLLGLEYRSVPVRGAQRQHKQPGFLALNTFVCQCRAPTPIQNLPGHVAM